MNLRESGRGETSPSMKARQACFPRRLPPYGESPQGCGNQHQCACYTGDISCGEAPIDEASCEIGSCGNGEHAQAEIGGENASTESIVAL